MATINSLKNLLKARGNIAIEMVEGNVKNRTIAPSAEIVSTPEAANTEEPEMRLGYKAYIQLALKTGMYKTLNVTEVLNGQLKLWDPVTERLVIEPEAKVSNAVVGYAGYFELFNGYKKCVYYTKSSLRNIGRRRAENETNFRKIALKEMLSKWGILSLDTQKAFVPELHEEVLLYKPLLKEEEIFSVSTSAKNSQKA